MSVLEAMITLACEVHQASVGRVLTRLSRTLAMLASAQTSRSTACEIDLSLRSTDTLWWVSIQTGAGLGKHAGKVTSARRALFLLVIALDPCLTDRRGRAALLRQPFECLELHEE